MKDYVGKWGYTKEEIIDMPREKFAGMFGQRFLDMGYTKFRKTLTNETPEANIPVGSIYSKTRHREDFKVSPQDYRSTQYGGYDEGEQGWIL